MKKHWNFYFQEVSPSTPGKKVTYNESKPMYQSAIQSKKIHYRHILTWALICSLSSGILGQGIDSLPSPQHLDTVIIAGVGDMMLGTNYPSDVHLPPQDGRDILGPVTPILQSADVAFGNLEGVLLSGEGNPKKCRDPKKCYIFKSPDHYVTYFTKAGFDVLSVANNHVGDFGEAGRKNTVRLLEQENIAFAGLETHPFTMFEKDSLTYGFCAFAPNTGTVKIHDYKKASDIITHLDSICDIVIVSFHGGAEGPSHNRITRQQEMYLGENRGNPYTFSRMAIDAGADVVFGHGPHVVRAIDLYKDRFIAYSLGNFATYGRFNVTGLSGLAPLVSVFTDKKGQFIKAKIDSARQKGEGGPILDPNNGAYKEIKRLTILDIPESNLEFQDETQEVFRKK